MGHNRLIGSDIGRIVCFIIGICNWYDHSEVAKLPCVHILYLLVWDFRPFEQRFQLLCIRFLPG